MRWAWIALVGILAGCHTVPTAPLSGPGRFPQLRSQVRHRPQHDSPPPTLSPASMPGGVVPATFTYRSAEAAPAVTAFPPVIQTAGHPVAASPTVRKRVVALGHGDNYRWLAGPLYRHHERWMIRYAPKGEPDRYQGTMELVIPGGPPDFREGMIVRVEGEILDPSPMEIEPCYRVRHLTYVRR